MPNSTFCNVPRLRFPGFEGEWESNKLSTYLYENKERNRADEFNKSDVLSVSGDCGIVNQIELLGRSFAGKSVADYHIVRTGNIVYTKSPLKEYPYGIVKYNSGKDGIVSTLYAVYHHRENVNGRFVEHYFTSPQRTNRYFKPIVRIGAKHDMKIGNNEVLDNIVVFPGLEEQNKITELLDLLNQRIAIQNKTIAHYESLIRALYCNVFSLIKGNRVLLSEIVQIQKGKQINGEDLSDTGRYYVMNGGVVPSGYYDQYNTEANTISISEGGNSCGYVQYNIEPFWSGGHCYSLLNPSSEIDYKFLYHFLKYHQDDIMSLRIGSGLPNIQKKDIERFPVTLPSFSEQVRYTKVFDAISSLVTTEKQILEQLIMRKDYLIQNLFI